jgi:hypothetical protein
MLPRGGKGDVCESKQYADADRGRVMTYQVAFRGKDGMVIASDRREFTEPPSKEYGTGSRNNDVRKIYIDQSGRFAWAFAGGEFSPIVASLLKRELDSKAVDFWDNEEVEQAIRECTGRVWNEGTQPVSTIVFLDGWKKKIRRFRLLPNDCTTFIDFANGSCLAGQAHSKASIFPEKFYSPGMSVDQLCALAAYTVYMAHKSDPLLIAGFDMAVFRESTKKFSLVSSTAYWKTARHINKEMHRLFRATQSIPR